MLAPITATYAALLGLILVGLSLSIVRLRLLRKVSLSDGGYPDLLVALRCQGNFVEYVPGASATWLVIAAASAIVLWQRLMHGA